MVLIQLLITGIVVGAICTTILLLVCSLEEVERYPLAAFLPAFLIMFLENDLSSIMVAGLLIMGGFLGNYLIIAIGKSRSKKEQDDPKAPIVETETVNKPTSLADYL